MISEWLEVFISPADLKVARDHKAEARSYEIQINTYPWHQTDVPVLLCPGWQPIETAPKDRTEVLIYCTVESPYDPKPPLVTVAWWEPRHQAEWFREDRHGNQIERKRPKYTGAWINAVTTDHGQSDVTYNATYWMPLPPPPAQEPAW